MQNVISRLEKTQELRCRKCGKGLKMGDVVMGKSNSRRNMHEKEKKYYHKRCYDEMLL